VLVGVLTIGGSWAGFHRLWLTGLVAFPIAVWWGYFLVLWPRLMAQLMERSAASPFPAGEGQGDRDI